MPVSGVDSERNYTNYIDKTNSSGKMYNAVFEDKDESDLSVSDFFNLMITQLTNQDFMNPVDDTQYLAQMAQFSTMQEMMSVFQTELCYGNARTGSYRFKHQNRRFHRNCYRKG